MHENSNALLFWKGKTVMGGKSRKSGGVSKTLINRLTKNNFKGGNRRLGKEKDRAFLLKALVRHNSDERTPDAK